MRKAVGLLTFLSLMLGATSASARSSVTTNPTAMALAIAERYWGGTPSCGKPHLSSSATLPSEVEAGAGQELLGKGLLLAWTYDDRCEVVFNVEVWRNWLVDDGNFQWYCDTMVHEVGHLFGHADDGQLDQRSVQYPILQPGSPNYNSVPECRGVRLYLGGHSVVGR